MKVFDGDTEEERFNFVFNVLAGYMEKKETNRFDEVIQACIDQPEECKQHPSVALTVLVFTTAVKKDSVLRPKLYNIVDEIYKKKLDDKKYKFLMAGLK